MLLSFQRREKCRLLGSSRMQHLKDGVPGVGNSLNKCVEAALHQMFAWKEEGSSPAGAQGVWKGCYKATGR